MLSQLVEENLLAGQARCFPVVVAGELLGLITLDDVRKVPRDEWATTSVYKAMTPFSRLQTATPRDDLSAVLAQLNGHDINQVPLVEGKQLVGLIHRADVLRYIQVRQEVESAKPGEA
jgi:CBS domain-containing protein